MMEPLTLRERIIMVFTNEKMRQYVLFHGHYPLTLATWNIRSRLGDSHTCAEIRKELIELEKDGYLHKDLQGSRGGQTAWR